jgi:protein ImuB
VAKVDNALRLSAVDRKATSLGLAIGQPLANARAMLPALKVVAANEPDDVKLLTRIADWCDRFTPYVALDGPRGLLLDVTGAAHLFGGEQALLNRIRESLKAQGFAVRGAMAGTTIAARAFARYRDGAVIAPG